MKHPREELIERFPHWTLIIYIKLHQYAPISLYLKDSYDLWTVSYSILYRTSTWCPAVRKDNFSSPTALPTVPKLRPSNRFPVLGVMLCSILLPMHTLRIMSSNNVSRFLPGVVNFVWRDKKIFFWFNFLHYSCFSFFESIFYIIRVFAKSFKFIITIFLNNYVQTYSSQVHTQYLTYNYTIIIYINLNINLQ